MRYLTGLVALIAVSAGCEGLPVARLVPIKPRLADRDAVAKALPKDLTLGQVVEADRLAIKKPITLEEKLAEVGAWVGPDGKLCDSAGKELYFYHIIKTGTPTHFSEDERRIRERRELEEKHRVIAIDDTPGHDPV